MRYIEEIFEIIPGNAIWVDSAANSTSANGSFNRPLLTLQEGVDKATASNGDMVLVKAGHTEANTAKIDFDKAGVHVRGLGRGNLRPTLTANGSAYDTIDVTADNCTLENFIFAAPGFDAATADINVAAAGFTCRNCKSIGSQSAKNKVAYITITADGDDCLIEGFRGHTNVVDMVSGIDVAAAARVEIVDCQITGNGTVGYTLACISDSGTALGLQIHHCFLNTLGAAVSVVEFSSNSVGLMWDCSLSGRHNTILTTVTAGSGMDFFENYATANVSKNGLIAPTIIVD